MDALLEYLTPEARGRAFETNLVKLQTSLAVDTNVLNICVQLLPLEDGETRRHEGALVSSSPHDHLWSLIQQRILSDEGTEQLYAVAEICLSNKAFAAYINAEIHRVLASLADDVVKQEDNTQKAVSYLRFLTCSFWLPSNAYHPIKTESVTLLSRYIGVHVTDDLAHDALSALFALLKIQSQTLITSQTPFSSLTSKDQKRPIIDNSLWLHLQEIGPAQFMSSRSKVFRTWFQWISQVENDGIQLSCIHDELYWERLRLGLINGFAGQRKFCLGIIRQSLLAASRDISTATMKMSICERDKSLASYANFSMLFETIVLNRYSAQVEASLPYLTDLLGSSSLVSPAMLTALLTAALSPEVQEGVRKLIGNWYISNICKVISGFYDHTHMDFLFEGFLPWALDGNLFTSSMNSVRTQAGSAHGNALADLIIRLIATSVTDCSNLPPKSLVVNRELDWNRRKAIVLGVVRLVTNTGGKIYHPAVLYLLEGLIEGLKACSQREEFKQYINLSEFAEIVDTARLSGFPEVARDLLSVYCGQLCDYIDPVWRTLDISGSAYLSIRLSELDHSREQLSVYSDQVTMDSQDHAIKRVLDQLQTTRHKSIQGLAYLLVCKNLIQILDQTNITSDSEYKDLYDVMEAMWEEADRRVFARSIAIHLPALLFHPTCINACVGYGHRDETSHTRHLSSLLTKSLEKLQQLSQGRVYLVAPLAKAIRKVVLSNIIVVDLLPIDRYIIDFINNPPEIQSEFLFEVVAAEKLQLTLPHRTFKSYYGEREWHAYAAIIDLLQYLFHRGDVAKRILNSLLLPWSSQQAQSSLKRLWKQTSQLQALLILSDYCITESEAGDYFESFMYALINEPWPRYRYLLEWIVARLYCKHRNFIQQRLDHFTNMDSFTPTHIASLIKLGLLVAPHNSENFATNLATQLTSFSSSPKVQIRHEANFAFPILFNLAGVKEWKSITENPAIVGLNAFIRKLDRFNTAPWTIRTLRLDIEKDFTLAKIFQGEYLSIESPEPERVAYEDFVILETKSTTPCTNEYRVPLGDFPTPQTVLRKEAIKSTVNAPSLNMKPAQTFLQTKASFDLNTLLPTHGPPHLQNTRPATIILIASLVDNPTNLGGLSRISESFGIEAMYINDLKKIAHKDFKATSMTSEKHFPIYELKDVHIPNFLLGKKRDGYTVVGIEQTDRSAILGHASETSKSSEKDIGTLPEKCVLVLGSEKEGISVGVLAVLDNCVEIKTMGVTRSLNVQTAGGIALYEWWREWSSRL